MTTIVLGLEVQRPTFAVDMSDEEREIMGPHAAHWQPYIDSGQMAAFGPALEETGSSGRGVTRAVDENEVRAFASHDPAVTSGTATVAVGALAGDIRPR